MLKLLLITIALLLSAACDDYPKDAEASLERAEARQTLRIGVIEHRPWAFQTENGLAGVEVVIVSEFARSLGLTPDWQYLPEARATEMLENFQLDLVIGGLTNAAPRQKRVGLTRPYLAFGTRKQDQHVIAAPPGENRLITTLEIFLRPRAGDIREMYATATQQ